MWYIFGLRVLSIILIVLIVSNFDNVSHVFGPFIPLFSYLVIGNLVLADFVFSIHILCFLLIAVAAFWRDTGARCLPCVSLRWGILNALFVSF